MDIEVLRNFAEIVDSGSITAASKKLYVTQATLSMQLKNLEKELGVVLIIRTAHRMELTSAGIALYKRAACIREAESSMKSEIAALAKGEKGRIRIGVSHSEGINGILNIVDGFLKLYENIGVDLYEREDNEIPGLIESGAIGIAFLRTPCSIPDMNIKKLSCDTAVVISGEDKEDKEYFKISDLNGKRIALLRKYEELFKLASCKNNVSSVIVTVVDTPDLLLSDSLHGVYKILPEALASGKGKKYGVLKEKILETEKIMVYNKSGLLNGAERLFIDYVNSSVVTPEK